MALTRLSPEARQYLLVTGNYWAFTLTDGALRMLVVLYFHGLGYSPLAIASLFIFYEIWQSQAHLDVHSNLPHMQQFRDMRMEYLERAFDIRAIEMLSPSSATR